MQLRPIEIDVDVFRFLESRRTSFAQTHNDILREVAGLPTVKLASTNGANSTAIQHSGWSWKGVALPNGTKLRMSYNGQTHAGEIMQGAWHVGGAIYRTPSAAAGGVARSKKGAPVSLDGWEYWEIQKPDSDRWVPIDKLRK
jgi:hypothetical protein